MEQRGKMDGFVLAFWGLASTYTTGVMKTITTREGLRSLLRRAITFKHFFCMIGLLFYVYECGSDEDIDSVFHFFSMLYRFSLSFLFKDILTFLGTLCLVWYACAIRYPRVAIGTPQLLEHLVTQFHEFHTMIWVFFSLEDGYHVGRNKDKKSDKAKKRLGIPKALRPLILDGRPQITPQQSPTGSLHQRGSSGTSVASGPGQRKGSGQSIDSQLGSPGGITQQRSSSGGSGSGQQKCSGKKQNGSASGSKRGKGKKKR